MKSVVLSILVLLCYCQYGTCDEKYKVNGVVTDTVTKEPVEGAVVVLREDKTSATCDKDGNFTLETKRKKVTVIVQLGGYKTYIKRIESPYEPLKIELDISSDFTLGKVYVKDKYKIEGSKQKVKAEQIKKTTQPLFADSLKVIQVMPGVVTGNDFSSLMYIRGGEFYEMICLLDNVFIPSPYMWGGIQSVFNPSFIDKIDFYSGGFPAKYPQAMSGVLDVKNIEGDYQKHSGFVDLGTTCELFVQGPIKKDKSSYVFGIRRTYYDIFANLGYGKGIVFPYFYDTQSKFTWKLNDKDKIYASFLGSYEGMDFDSAAVSNDTGSGTGGQSFKFKYADIRVTPGINWERVENERLSFNLSLSDSYEEGDSRFSGTDTESQNIFKQYNAFLRSKITYLSGIHTFEQGVYLDNASVYAESEYTYRTLTSSGTYYPGKGTNKIDWTQFFVSGIYLQDDMALIPDKLFLNIGGILEYLEYSKDTTFCPRGGIKYSLTEDTILKFNTGLYTQFPVSSMGGTPPVMRNHDIDSEKAVHYILGVEQELPNNFFFRLEAFVKDYKDLTVSDPDPDIKVTNKGNRRVNGFDVFLQRKISEKWDGWIAYTYLDSQDKILERNNPLNFIGVNPLNYPQPLNEWYSSSKERKHNLALVLNYDITPKYKLALTYRYSTGMPYTPIISGIKYPGADVYLPVYGEFNSGRMPDYTRCDVKFTLPMFKLKNWECYVQVINLFNHQNVDQYYYSDDYSTRYSADMFSRMIIGGFKYNF